jgi:hypothetical protein
MSAPAAALSDPIQQKTEPQTQLNTPVQHQDIETLAYALWQQRGCPVDSPEVDWIEAEQIIKTSSAAPAPAELPGSPTPAKPSL